MKALSLPVMVRVLLSWLGLGLVGLALAQALGDQSHWFGYDFRVVEMPVLTFVTGAMVAGGVFCVAVLVVRRSLEAGVGGGPVLVLMLGFGLAFRLALLASQPVLEDDYQRYLWDGAMTAHGFNPYAISPKYVRSVKAPRKVVALGERAGEVVPRINHPELKTVYPPVAQFAFAIAHQIRPFSLGAWRALCFVGDLATLGLILVLLREIGRPLLWSMLYWWNPIVIKELTNSVHMEAVLMPLVLLALWLAARRRNLLACTIVGLAAGVKIWPALLLPLVARRLAVEPARLALGVGIFAALSILWLVPVLLGGIDPTSGFVAYVSRWKTNSALFPLLEGAAGALRADLGWPWPEPAVIARLAIAGVVGAVAIGVALTVPRSSSDLLRRAALVVGALVLASPAQFPWYTIWIIAFLPFFPPITGFLVLTLTMPLYYSAFHFMAVDELATFTRHVVWWIWLPVWSLLLMQFALTGYRSLSTGRGSATVAS